MLNFPIFPHEFSNLTIWVPVYSWSISKIVDKLPLITLTICPSIRSIPTFDIILILSLVLVIIIRSPFTFTVPLTFHKLALVNAPIVPWVTTKPLKFSINKLPLVFISVYQFLITISTLYSIHYISFKVKTIISKNYCFTCFFSILEITNISIILLINIFSISVRFSFFPLSVIGCK